MESGAYEDTVRYLRSSDTDPVYPPSILQLQPDARKNAKRGYRQKWPRDKFEVRQVGIDAVIIKLERRKVHGETRAAELRLLKADETARVLEAMHTDDTGGHLGMMKTKEKIGERYFWKGYAEAVEKYCAKCVVCLKANKMPKKTPALYPVGIPRTALMQWGMDLVQLPETPDGYKYAMVLTEYTTKWPMAYPIRDKRAATVFKVLKHLIGHFGCPETIISDQGREFCNELNDIFCSKFKINRRVTTAYRPQGNGLTERYNQTLCNMLTKYTEGGKTDWTEDLDLFMLAYRSSRQESSKYTPFELMHGQKARLPVELDLATDAVDEVMSAEERIEQLVGLAATRDSAVDNAKAAQQNQKVQYAKKHGGVQRSFNVGDSVLYANARKNTREGGKVTFKNYGPTTVEEVCKGNTYRLHGVKRLYHVDHLMRAPASSSPTATADSNTDTVNTDTAAPPHLKRRKAVPKRKWWVKELQLDTTHRALIVQNDWLDDTVMDAAQKLIQTQLDPSEHHQSTLMASHHFSANTDQLVLQLLYNGNNHWLLVSTTAERIFIYDSLSAPITPCLSKQLKDLFAARLDKNGALHVERVAVHQQPNGHDCGVFAVAFAFFLLDTKFGADIRCVRFDERIMREHLIYCLENQQVVAFPTYIGSTPGKNDTSRAKAPKANIKIVL